MAIFCGKPVASSWSLLKITYGLLFVVAGADKFFDLVTKWHQYVNPVVPPYFVTDKVSFLYGVGIWEIVLGLIILAGFTRIGGYLAALWLLAIIVNLVTMGQYFDIAVRDAVMAVGALVLAWLTPRSYSTTEL